MIGDDREREAEDDEPTEAEENAFYRVPAYHPNASAPRDFVKLLRPAGLSTEILSAVCESSRRRTTSARAR